MRFKIGGRFVLTGLIIVFSAIALAMLPLCSDFHYEFAVINAVLISFVSGLFAIRVMNTSGELTESANSIIRKLLPVLVFPLLPIPIVFFSALIRNNSGLLYGLPLFCVYVLPAPIIGSAIGAVICFFFRHLRRLMFSVVFVFICLAPLYEFFYWKNIFFYNPIFFYFPGTIYDESVALTLTQICYRLINLIFFSSMLIVIFQNQRHAIKRARIIALVTIGLAMFFYSAALGFSTNDSKLQSSFNRLLKTEHCSIYYNSGDFDSLGVVALGVLHETYYKQLKQYFECEPEIVKSYIFTTSRQKYKLIGAGNADVTKPHQHEFYLSLNSYQRTLKHEMAHVFSSAFGRWPVKIPGNASMLLLEGAAVAAAGQYNEFDLEYMARLAIISNPLFRVTKQLSGFGFFTSSSDMAYILSGAFCKYLIDSYGIGKFKQLYYTGSVKSVYGLELDSLEQNYISYAVNKNYPDNSALASLYFKRRTVFQKKCPHLVAALLEDVESEFDRKNFYSGLEILDRVETFSNEPRVIFLKAYGFENTNRPAQAVNLIRNFIKNNTESSFAMPGMLRLGNMLAKYGNLDSADVCFTAIIDSGYGSQLESIARLVKYLLQNCGNFTTFLNSSAVVKQNMLIELAGKKNDILSLWALDNYAVDRDSCYQIMRRKLTFETIDNSISDPIPFADLALTFTSRLDFNLAESVLRLVSEHVPVQQREYIAENINLVRLMAEINAARQKFKIFKLENTDNG